MREKDEFEQKRIARRRKMRKKRIKRTVISLLVISVITLAVLCLTVLFPVKYVTSSGSKIYKSDEIIKASQISGKNLFRLSEKKIEEEIRKKLPFVDSVKVTRSLPDSVHLKIKDASEYAVYLNKGKFYTVSEKGYVLKEYTSEPVGLLKIICTEQNLKCGEAVKYKTDSEKELINNIIAITKEKNIFLNLVDVTNKAAIKIRVLDRFDVNFGTSANLEKKINHLNGMIKSIGEGRNGSIDLSMWTPKKSEGSFTQK